ncbi:hypothetical protein BDV27DRAFT_71261 [Aspergillus caelatus]|uniref:Uncharacterized protein n=2 Tax=Aspergillus subgen. Circumdati TaxID=2720871 RepID=A0A5N6ZKZ1_9EURO|nr:uncharacterized protein BDV27DRAFT_71261 [Aspergillus caelatus]KAE8358292.1 hypothetical protein BDV27DRAFT_71261 [Aspergillus caelatus]KAE8418831.1 hypothetical protein BDV36DRAFT_150515 [Aspergillus pseudocaelatus]
MGRSTHISLIWHLFFFSRFVLPGFLFCLPSPFLFFQHHSLLYILRYISSLGRNRRSTKPCRIMLCRCTELNTENNQDSPLFPAPTDPYLPIPASGSVCYYTIRFVPLSGLFFFFSCFLSIGAELIPLLCVSTLPDSPSPCSLLLDFTHMHFHSC